MKKIFSWISDNILFLCTIALMVFIPLYPKLPLLDIKNTWVYVRVEDFLVLFVLLVWGFLLLKRKISLKTPLTLPIIIFWIVGAIATIHGVVLIFPNVANVFPNVAFLNFIRHIEYMSVFFVAYAGMRDKKLLKPVLIALVITLLAVIFYGAGQKYMGLPAYLTMNEEYAKGVPIQLSQLSRVPSTFAGHYDLAAYLVLVIPILVSLIFGVKNLIIKGVLGVSVVLGFWLLFATVSRVSFFVLILVLGGFFALQKKKLLLYALPVIAICAFLFISIKPTLLARFNSTVKQVEVLVDGKTGQAVGEVKFVPAEYFKDKVIRQQRVQDREQLDIALTGGEETSISSPSAVLPFELLDPKSQVAVVLAANVSNGENLPQGTGYINLPLSPVIKRVGNFFYEFPQNIADKAAAEVLIVHGNFIIKRASAYDLSFTTRFQGEWPHAILAFQRNVLIGSGYGSVSIAIDNNYFRMLGETGLLGLLAFFALFITLAIYIKKVLPSVDSPVARSFVIGFAVGVVGLALNATLIDVFEASKIAFLLWILMGVTFGILVLYQRRPIDLGREFIKVATSSLAIIIYLIGLAVVIYTPMLANFFVADDFTWFRWAADCVPGVSGQCSSVVKTISTYFTEAGGFFYRPGTKLYFDVMYSIFWLNQNVYHMVSLLLHVTAAALFYFIAKRILKNNMMGAAASLLFLVMSGYAEIVFWISATGHLFNAVFILASLLFFMLWDEKKKGVFYLASIISMVLSLLFYELGIVVPLLIIVYKMTQDRSFKLRDIFKGLTYPVLFVPSILYLLVRFAAGSHWQGGDYSYNLIKLPFNVAGNLIGYLGLAIIGPLSLSFYEKLRSITRENLVVSAVGFLIITAIVMFTYRKFYRHVDAATKRVVCFGVLFFIIALLPFIGFGNITSRYSYVASLGIIIIMVFYARRLYDYLLENGQATAIAAMTLIVAVFSLLHVIQVQQLQLDWRGAGQASRNFFVAIDDAYSDYFSTEPMEFHFVNVPVKVGEAWVFPVGLNDALWFAFKNPRASVFVDQEVTLELQKQISRNFKVFKFNGDGSVEAIQPPKGATISPTLTPPLTPLRR